MREDGQFLFGFASREELTLFEMLISVNGVGPRAALALLAISRPGDLAAAIAAIEDEAAAALQALGYTPAEAAAALRSVPPASAATTEERVRAALRRAVRVV